MKRFWTETAVVPADGGYAVALDAKPLRTPARRLLVVPGRALAEGIAAEWRAQGETVAPAAMVLTKLANSGLDRVPELRAAMLDEMAGFGGADLLCYRAEGPDELVARQAAAWDPPLAWARTRYDIEPVVTSGLMPVAQPDGLVARLRAALAWRPDLELAPLGELVGGFGSLILALALIEGELDFGRAWAAAQLDEAWAVERWGDDAEAAARTAARRRGLEAAHRFLRLLRDG